MNRTTKITLTTVSAIIVLAGTAVCVIRWQAWFGNPAEKPYTVSNEPHNIVLTYGENASSSRIVSWRAGSELQESDVQLLSWQSRDTLHIPAEGCIVESRAGEAAYYRSRLDTLRPGNYSYRCSTGDVYSEWYPVFVADKSDRLRMQEFLLFGDIQDKSGEASAEMFNKAFTKVQTTGSSLSGVLFAGDIIERPTDEYWQLFFSSFSDRQATIPVIAATGNHEYLKGVRKKLDLRWTHIFGNPQNGPERFKETTYYIDFPLCRFIVLDTDGMQVMSDYTVMQTWLDKILEARKGVWKIVVMHHPVYAAGKGRDNPLIRFALRRTLRKADVVFCGHDHNYMRLTEKIGKPLYILTNSSEKFYVPKTTLVADCHAAYLRFYEDVKIWSDSISIDTWNVEDDVLFDHVTICK